MLAYTVVIRNPAGREETRLVPAKGSNAAANHAVRAEERATNERWYVVRCDARGSEIRA